MTTEQIKRSSYWDNIKGFLIILTVFAHILFQLQDNSATINRIVDYIYMFHMPAFVFVSGYFGKSERSHSFGSILKLLIIYYIFNSIMGFIYGFESLLIPMYSFWYLIALAVWRLTAHHIAKFKEIVLILFTVSIFIGFYISVDNTLAAARIICFYPYYMAGFLLSHEESKKLENTAYIKRFIKGLLFLFAAAAIAIPSYMYLSYSDSSLQMLGYNDPKEAFGRIILYAVAFLAIYALRHISANRKIPFLTMVGRNSLCVFIFHRPFTLILSDLIKNQNTTVIIAISLAGTFLLCAVFGNDIISKYFSSFADKAVEIFTENSSSKKLTAPKIVALLVSLFFIVSVVIQSYSSVSLADIKKFISGEKITQDDIDETCTDDIIYPIMTSETKQSFDDAFRITFAGDLILLEDQVKRAFNGTEYDFSEMFEYTEKYISSADYAIGVFEGPMAGAEVGYSTSNFDDNKELYLNFPDSFAVAVKNSGFDLVTTANNHLLDKGTEGALRTLDVLDKTGIEHIGSYRNEAEKQSNHIKLIETDGIRIAVLAYTYGCNYYDTSMLTDENMSYLTSVISGTSGELFEKCKTSVEQDFAEAKALSPDLIIVLPHIGTQFSNEPDEEQNVWFEIFKQNGADIILGDHPHVIEPTLIEEYNGKTVFTAYCPGNYANIYRDNQGDTSALIDVYIDRNTKQIIGGGIVPLYTQSLIDGNYRAIPIYDIMNDSELRLSMSTDDLKRAEQSIGIITEVVFGNKMDISSVTERYYFNKEGFIREKAHGLILTDEMRSGTLYNALANASSICFIGDSVTEGTKNGGSPWYEPIEEYLSGKIIYNYSKGGCTVSYISERADEIPDAQLYVIALGTNDVRYRDEKICAMSSEDYIASIDLLKQKLSDKCSNAEFIFIAPWYSIDGDAFCSLSFSDKTKLNEEYCTALEQYCTNNMYGYINANLTIKNRLDKSPEHEFLLDHIHPNCTKGVVMYSEAVLLN